MNQPFLHEQSLYDIWGPLYFCSPSCTHHNEQLHTLSISTILLADITIFWNFKIFLTIFYILNVKFFKDVLNEKIVHINKDLIFQWLKVAENISQRNRKDFYHSFGMDSSLKWTNHLDMIDHFKNIYHYFQQIHWK